MYIINPYQLLNPSFYYHRVNNHPISFHRFKYSQYIHIQTRRHLNQQNSKLAWWGENVNLGTWIICKTLSICKTIRLLVSLKTSNTDSNETAQMYNLNCVFAGQICLKILCHGSKALSSFITMNNR